MSVILVVDDDAWLGHALTKILGSEGYTVQVSHTAADALVAIQEGVPDVLLLDLGLPDMDGLMLLARLRERGPDRAIPVVVISARDNQADRVLSLKFGADD